MLSIHRKKIIKENLQVTINNNTFQNFATTVAQLIGSIASTNSRFDIN